MSKKNFIIELVDGLQQKKTLQIRLDSPLPIIITIDQYSNPCKIQIISQYPEIPQQPIITDGFENSEKRNYNFETFIFCRKCKSSLHIPQENYCPNCGYPA